MSSEAVKNWYFDHFSKIDKMADARAKNDASINSYLERDDKYERKYKLVEKTVKVSENGQEVERTVQEKEYTGTYTKAQRTEQDYAADLEDFTRRMAYEGKTINFDEEASLELFKTHITKGDASSVSGEAYSAILESQFAAGSTAIQSVFDVFKLMLRVLQLINQSAANTAPLINTQQRILLAYQQRMAAVIQESNTGTGQEDKLERGIRNAIKQKRIENIRANRKWTESGSKEWESALSQFSDSSQSQITQAIKIISTLSKVSQKIFG